MSDINQATPNERAEAKLLLLANSGFKFACDRVRENIIDAWRASDPADVAGRERWHVAAGTLDEIITAVQLVANGGSDRDVRASVDRMGKGKRNG